MRVWGRHVEPQLVLALEGELSPERARGVEAHLAVCAGCRAARDEIARGLTLARQLLPARLPEERAAALRTVLETVERPPRERLSRRRWVLHLAAALVLATGAVFLRAWQAPRLEPAPPQEDPTAFEQIALGLHERGITAGGATLVTAAVPEARAWARARTGLDVSLPAVRPVEDEGRFELRGMRALDYRGAPALAVWFRLDGRPVTLLTAREGDVPDRAAAWSLAGKRVRHRPIGERKLLSWTNSGQAYVLVSDLPPDGRRACFVCHTQPGRRQLIERLGR